MKAVVSLFVPCLLAGVLSAQPPAQEIESPETPTVHKAVVPVMGRVTGAGGVEWIGSISLTNDSFEDVFVGMTFLAGQVGTMAFSISPGDTVSFGDIGGEVFGTPGILGPLLVNSIGTRPIRINAIATPYEEGKPLRSHSIPTVAPYQPAGVSILPRLSFTDETRVNLGIENLGEEPATVSVAIQLIEGRNIAATTLTIPPETLYHAPIRMFFPLLTEASDMTVVVDTPHENVFAYATEVDNATQQGRFVSPRSPLGVRSTELETALQKE